MIVKTKLPSLQRNAGLPDVPSEKPEMRSLQPKTSAIAPPVYRPTPSMRPAPPSVYSPKSLPATAQAKTNTSGCSVCHSRPQYSVAVFKLAQKNLLSRKDQGVAQRISCSVYRNGREAGSSPDQGKGGTPGVSHAEQKAWRDANIAKADIARGDVIKFDVDGPICPGCVTWFESTLHPLVQGAGGTLMVQCNRDDYFGSVMVTGKGTKWGNISETGFYGPGGQGRKG